MCEFLNTAVTKRLLLVRELKIWVEFVSIQSLQKKMHLPKVTSITFQYWDNSQYSSFMYLCCKNQTGNIKHRYCGCCPVTGLQIVGKLTSCIFGQNCEILWKFLNLVRNGLVCVEFTQQSVCQQRCYKVLGRQKIQIKFADWLPF